MIRFGYSTFLLVIFALFTSAPAFAATGMMAGTGKALIDPPAAMMPVHNMPNDPKLATIHDSLFARALVVDSDGQRAVIVVADIIVLPDDSYDRIVTRLAEAYKVPRDHIWISATHAHTVPWGLGNGYEAVVSDGIMGAVAQATAHREHVTIGTGEGKAYININRDEETAAGFILGQDPHGASDKTVRVTGLFRDNGSPLAILPNYAVHAVALHSSFTNGDESVISADIPGVVDAFVDAHYPGALTLWTSGAAGDQNPVLMSYYAEPGADGVPVSTDLKNGGLVLTQRLGQNLGLEIIRTTDAIKPVSASGIHAAQSVVSCPAKDGGSTPIRLSWLNIGGIDLIGISGEVTTAIDQHLRKALPGRSPLTLTLTNGYSGYLPDDASYTRGETFEVRQSHVKAGCAEAAIVDTAVRLVTAGG